MRASSSERLIEMSFLIWLNETLHLLPLAVSGAEARAPLSVPMDLLGVEMGPSSIPVSTDHIQLDSPSFQH